MILYGALSDTSIVQVFVAGVVPGLLGAAGLMGFSWFFAVRYDLLREEAFDLCRVWSTFRSAGWALILPLIILGGIFGGIVTATEGAGIAVLAALLIGGLTYRELDARKLYAALADGVNQTAVVMLLVAASAVLGICLTETRLPQRPVQGITTITTIKIAVLMIINVFLLGVGMVLHGAAAIILTLNIARGQQTPPVASVLITACSIAKTDVWASTRTNLPFIGVLVTYVPAVPLWLVGMFCGP